MRETDGRPVRSGLQGQVRAVVVLISGSDLDAAAVDLFGVVAFAQAGEAVVDKLPLLHALVDEGEVASRVVGVKGRGVESSVLEEFIQLFQATQAIYDATAFLARLIGDRRLVRVVAGSDAAGPVGVSAG